MHQVTRRHIGRPAAALAFLLLGCLVTVAPPAGGTAPAGVSGMAWRPPHMVDPVVGQLHELDCASATFCRADELYGSVFTGRAGHWSPPKWAGQLRGLDSMTCPSPDFCAALNEQGRWVTNRGSGWSEASSTGVGHAARISCTSDTFCAAVGFAGEGKGNASTWNGTTWSAPVMFERLPRNLSCASPTFCVVTFFLGGASVYDGTGWGPRDPIEGADTLEYLSCPTDGFCAATSLDEATVYDGGTWSEPVGLTEAGGQLADVSCMTDRVCLVVEVAGIVHTFRDGTWQTSKPIGTRIFTDIDCPATDYCLAMKDNGLVYVYGGASWQRSTSIAEYTHGVHGVACPVRVFCLAVDATGAAVQFDGHSWTRPMQVDGLERLVDVSCPSQLVCFSIARSGAFFRYDGATSTWKEQPALALPNDIGALDCPDESFCLAIDITGSSASFDGVAWTPRGLLPVLGKARLSCATPQFCGAAVGKELVRWDGASWQQRGPYLDPSSRAISCPEVGFCMVTGDFVATSYRKGHFETRETDISYGSAVSCVSSTFCLASDTDYQVATYDGAAWSSPTYIGPGERAPFGSDSYVSCSSRQICTVMIDQGWAIRSHG